MAATDEPLCADCVAHEGLCHIHAREICPAPLRTNFPVWLMGTSYHDMERERVEAESPGARKIRERKTKKKARAVNRLTRAIAGEYTRSVPRGA